jgi:type IV secretory pathway TrbL component
MNISFRRIFIFTLAGILAFILIVIFGALGSAIFLGPIAAAVDVTEFQMKTRLSIISVSLVLGLLVFPWP